MSHGATSATDDDDGAFEVRVAPKRYWFGLVFVHVFLAGWMAAGIGVIGGMVSNVNAASPNIPVGLSGQYAYDDKDN